MSVNEKFNSRSPAVKRILQEMKELSNDNSPEYVAEALEDNIFEWHFVIRGPVDTAFEGGFYHGRILLPAEYPFKPPSFIMLTPSGRFEVGRKICLSISEKHPEEWQPSWSLRTALTALIAFLPTPGKGALGSLDFPKEDIQALAAKSKLAAPTHGNEDRQKLLVRLHQKILDRQNAQQLGDAQSMLNETNFFQNCQKDAQNSKDLQHVQQQQQQQQQQPLQIDEKQVLNVQPNNSNTNIYYNRMDQSRAVVIALAVAIFALVAKKIFQYFGFNILRS